MDTFLLMFSPSFSNWKLLLDKSTNAHGRERILIPRLEDFQVQLCEGCVCVCFKYACQTIPNIVQLEIRCSDSNNAPIEMKFWHMHTLPLIHQSKILVNPQALQADVGA